MRKLKSEGEMFVVGVTNFWVVARCGQLPHESFYFEAVDPSYQSDLDDSVITTEML